MVPSLGPVSIQSPEMTWAAAVWMGVLASLNVCAVVRLPILATYVMSVGVSRKRALVLTALFALGLAGGTVLLGLSATPQADGIHKSLQVSKYAFWLLGPGLIVAGVLLSGLINPQLVPQKWRRVSERLVKTDRPGALLLGLVFGLLQTPACPTCRAEFLSVVETVPVGGIVGGLLLLTGFALGQSFVTLGVGMVAALLRPDLVTWLRTRMCSIEPRMQLLAGDMLVVLGIYFVVVG